MLRTAATLVRKIILAARSCSVRRRKTLTPLLVFALLSPLNIAGQRKTHKENATPETERTASNAHSFMELFAKLEGDWLGACQRKDRAALEELLAPEFSVRFSSDPEHIVTRTDWIADAMVRNPIQFSRDRAMTIRAFLGVAIVSFVRSEGATTGSDDSLIVDVWEVNNGKWQPTTRFVAPVGK
jgi:Domain of unknown function (DUF4440)